MSFRKPHCFIPVLVICFGFSGWGHCFREDKTIPALKESLRLDLGGEFDGSPVASIMDAAVGADGSIYILDNRGGRVLRFDGNGEFLGAFGRPGQGPGELQRPLSLVRSTSGDIVVFDGHFSVFSGDGRFLKRYTGRAQSLIDAMFPAAGGGFLLSESRFRRTEKGVVLEKTIEKTGADFQTARTLFRRSDEYSGGGKSSASAFYSFTAGPAGELYVLDRSAKEYRILSLEPEGNFRPDITRPYRPVAKCPEDLTDETRRQKTAASRVAAMEGGSASPGGVNPEKFAVDDIAVDPSGRLWAATHGADPCDRTVYIDVFGPDRGWVERYRLGAFVAPRLKIEGDSLYVFDSRPDDEILLVRYDLKSGKWAS
ncbi:MAG: hypothetical protein JW843_06495 [Candidatus Aminicenantes bacterium]|nr:hypothetical protein [Candidatus Aminicenantes bacterium]